MDFNLAREIYGLTPWLMDIHSIPLMTNILKNIKNGVNLELPEVKLNTPFIFDTVSKSNRLITDRYDLRNEDEFTGVGIININGPITKSGGQSSMGMLQISNIMKSLAKDNRVKSFVILVDSGGGTSSAVEIMTDVINEVKKTKPVLGLITRGGMAASAAYGIISACNEVYSEDEMNIVGSVGTMIQFDGREANSKDANGVKHIRLYATKSTKKNIGFEEALNNDNYEIIINELLNPVNERFINLVSSNRPAINNADFDDGRTYRAKDVIGTYIDGIASFENVVNKSLKFNKKSLNLNPNSKVTKTKSKIMNKAELQSAHPETFAEIFAEGVSSERDRAGAWMAHNETDPAKVKAGILSGNAISQTEREELLIAKNTKDSLEAMSQGNAGAIIPAENKTIEQIANEKLEKEVDSAFDFEL